MFKGLFDRLVAKQPQEEDKSFPFHPAYTTPSVVSGNPDIEALQQNAIARSQHARQIAGIGTMPDRVQSYSNGSNGNISIGVDVGQVPCSSSSSYTWQLPHNLSGSFPSTVSEFANKNIYSHLSREKITEYEKHLAVMSHAQTKMEELLSGKQVVKKQKRIKLKL